MLDLKKSNYQTVNDFIAHCNDCGEYAGLDIVSVI